MIYAILIYLSISLTLTELLVEKGYTNKLRDITANNKAINDNFINNLFFEWTHCQICSTNQTMLAFSIFNLAVLNFEIAFILFLLATPYSFFVKWVYKTIK
jgi:hypothetical protein